MSRAPVVTVTSDYAQRCMPYKVRTSCGHIVVRKMRPATAGVPFSDDVVLEAPNGLACADCKPGIARNDVPTMPEKP